MSFLGGYGRRHALGAVSEDKLEKFAKKVAAGKSDKTTFEIASELINRLPGWSASPVVGAYPAGIRGLGVTVFGRSAGRIPFVRGYFDNETITFESSGLDLFRDAVSKGKIVISGGMPLHPALGVAYAEHEPKEEPEPMTGVLNIGKVWIGRKALLVSAPALASSVGSSSITVIEHPDNPNAFGIYEHKDFWNWAKQNDLASSVAKLIGAIVKPPSEQEEALQRIGTLDHVGMCPVCGRYQKFFGVSRGHIAMYDHGYQIIDGWWKQGSCFGIGFAPFEVSNAGTIAYINALDGWIAATARKITKARSGNELFNRQEKELNERGLPIYEGPSWNRTPKMITVTYAPDSVGYAEVQADEIQRLTADLARLKDSKAMMEAKARSWQRVPTYDEIKAGRLLY